MVPSGEPLLEKKRILMLGRYIFVAFQFKETSACFNSVEKKRERIKKIRRGNERGNRKTGRREGRWEGERGRSECKEMKRWRKGRCSANEGVMNR